jgi:hypothetical protein
MIGNFFHRYSPYQLGFNISPSRNANINGIHIKECFISKQQFTLSLHDILPITTSE